MNQMANFHEFSKSINTNNVYALPSKNESQKLVALNVKKELSCISSTSGVVINAGLATSIIKTPHSMFSSNNKEEQFSEELSQLVYSDNFLDELSDKIGQPTEAETEDEFVNRAKTTMRQMLKNKLSKK